jgi:putative NIF3 family GTP cyclohydrolase 1 type 2
MKAREMRDQFLEHAPWVDREHTGDKVLIGDPETDVDRCLVCWMADLAALREAVRRGVRLVVCHEPVILQHGEDKPEGHPARFDAKRRFAEDHGLIILRNHDAWDAWPGDGIPWSWAKFLGLEGEPVAMGPNNWQHRYDIPPVPFGHFATGVAARTTAIEQPIIELSGAADQLVSKIGIGTGCFCDVFTYLELGCDCCVVCDDGSNYWRGVQFAEDRGVPVICVNHATSEEPGVAGMARYINQHFDGITAEHLPQGCRFRLVGA